MKPDARTDIMGIFDAIVEQTDFGRIDRLEKNCELLRQAVVKMAEVVEERLAALEKAQSK